MNPNGYYVQERGHMRVPFLCIGGWGGKFDRTQSSPNRGTTAKRISSLPSQPPSTKMRQKAAFE